MIVEVRLFARAKDLAGAAAVPVDLPEGATAGELRRRLAQEYPVLQGLLQRSALAVNDEFSSDGQVIPDRADVALIPPVSGG